MSWHLQTLAKYGYVEEADGGVGRRRPWRLVSVGTSYDEDPDDTELSVAATAPEPSSATSARSIGSDRWMNERRQLPARLADTRGSRQNNISYLMPDELEAARRGHHSRSSLRYRERTVHPELSPGGLSTGERPRIRFPDSAHTLRQLTPARAPRLSQLTQRRRSLPKKAPPFERRNYPGVQSFRAQRGLCADQSATAMARGVIRPLLIFGAQVFWQGTWWPIPRRRLRWFNAPPQHR